MTQEYLREALDYDSDTGIFTWRVRPRNHFVSEHAWKRANTLFAGKVAGTPDGEGYTAIKIAHIRYKAHRLVWLGLYGKWPVEMLDHINGNRADNRLLNLREATCSENCKNQKRRNTNTSGVKGVSWDKKNLKWKAQLTIHGKNTYLGLYNSISEAESVLKAARRSHHREFANHGF